MHTLRTHPRTHARTHARTHVQSLKPPSPPILSRSETLDEVDSSQNKLAEHAVGGERQTVAPLAAVAYEEELGLMV